jgi:DNA-binding SARP family transcriptional activator/tetratricopeptide (TPR) repeat protein
MVAVITAVLAGSTAAPGGDPDLRSLAGRGGDLRDRRCASHLERDDPLPGFGLGTRRDRAAEARRGLTGASRGWLRLCATSGTSSDSVKLDHRPPVGADVWPGRRAAELVQLLALADGHRLTRDQVVEALWPHLEVEAGAANLRKAAHYARHALASSEAVVLRGGQVALFPSRPVETDAGHFEAQARAALAGGDAAACAAAASAYTGDLLPEALYEEWTQAPRERLRSRYVELLRRSGQWERLVEVEPTDEPAYRKLMRRELAGGSRPAAIRWYGRLRTALRRELGVGPSDDSDAIYDECVAGLGVAEPAFVGRQLELARVTALLRSEPGGALGALVVRGPAGIGKSALCREVARVARAEGWMAIAVGATEAGGLYEPLASVAEQLVARDRALLDAVGSRARSVLAELTSLAAPAAPLDSPLTRHRMIGAFRRLLLAAGDGAAVALVVDDAHLADEATIDVLHHLGSAGGTPVLAVLAYRPEPAPEALTRGVARLARGGKAVEIDLGPLDREDAAALVAAGAPTPRAAEVVDRIIDLAQGNPFLTLELPKAPLRVSRRSSRRPETPSQPGSLTSTRAPWRCCGAWRWRATSWIAAASQAVKLGAFADALVHLEPLLDHEPDHSDALCLRAEALDAIGDSGAPAAYAAAARVVGEPAAQEIRAKQALAQVKLGDPPGGLTVLEGVEPTTVNGRLAQALALSGAAALGFGDPQIGTAKAAEARRLAVQAGDPAAAAIASWAQAAAAHARGELRNSVRADLHETHALPKLAVSVFDGQLCITQRLLYGARPYSDVIAFADSLAAEAERLGAARGRAFAVTIRGEAKLLAGRLDEADADLAAGAELHREIAAATGESFALQRRAEVALHRGLQAQAVALLDEALAVARESDVGFHLLDRIYGTRVAAALDPASALAALEEAEAAVRGPVETCPGCRITLAVPAAIAAARAGDLERAAKWEQAAEFLATVVMRLPAWYAALDEVKGHRAQASGEAAAACDHFRTAAAGFGASGQPLDEARCGALAASLAGDLPPPRRLRASTPGSRRPHARGV